MRCSRLNPRCYRLKFYCKSDPHVEYQDALLGGVPEAANAHGIFMELERAAYSLVLQTGRHPGLLHACYTKQTRIVTAFLLEAACGVEF
jgi:hypothetical protein